jgi:ribulose bisphosphate carboxylase small subunit
VLTHRLTGGTSHSQTQQGKLTPEITRWQEARTRTQATEKQGYLASLELSSSTTVSTGYPKTLEKEDSHLESHLMMMIEDFKEDINNSLQKIQDNTGKQVVAPKEETQKSLK